MSKRDEYYQKVHEKELGVFKKVVRMVTKGMMFITSCSFEKMSVGNGYRFIVYLVDKE